MYFIIIINITVIFLSGLIFNLVVVWGVVGGFVCVGCLLFWWFGWLGGFLAGGFSGACYSAAVAWAFAGVLLAEFMAFSALWFGGLLLIGQKNTSFNSEVVGVVVFSVAS